MVSCSAARGARASRGLAFLMDRVSAVVRRLAALLGGIDYDAAAAADLPPPDSMEAMEAAEHDLAFLLGILPAFDHGPDIPKALNTMESWLDDYKHILPYPVTRAIVDRMVAVALEAGDADMPTGNEMSADAIRQRYAEYFVSDSDQLDAIYEDEQESSDGGIGLGDELPEVDVDERVQSIQRRQLWKETCVREYGVTLAETIKPFLVDPGALIIGEVSGSPLIANCE